MRGPLARQPISMSAVAAMSKMSPDPRLGALCASDRQGGGGKVPLGFLASFITHRHTPPERATTPLTLLHPGADAWTPVEVSMPWFTRIAAPRRLVLLPEAGQLPHRGAWLGAHAGDADHHGRIHQRRGSKLSHTVLPRV